MYSLFLFIFVLVLRVASFLLFFSLFYGVLADSKPSLKLQVDSALSLLTPDPENAELLCFKIMEEASNQNDLFGLVRSNYYLGYLNKKNGDFGKAIVYYLEGIRYGTDATYPGIGKDMIGLLKNTGNVFLKFKDYGLAEKYYNDALELARAEEDLNEYARIIYAQSRLFKSQGNYDEAITLLESLFDSFHVLPNGTIALIYNQLGLLHTKKLDSKKAEVSFHKLLSFIDGKSKLIQKYEAKTHHNIGNLHLQVNEYDEAIVSYQKALNLLREKKSVKDEELFLTIKDLGEAHLYAGDLAKAQQNFLEAEKYFASSKNIPNYYDLHKFLGLICKEQGNIEDYATYQNTYAQNLEAYVAERHEIEASDKKYNLDLITQRYYAMVAEQERNKQIVFYSQIGGASLISLLMAVVGIFFYRRWKLKKDLEQAIKPFTNRI